MPLVTFDQGHFFLAMIERLYSMFLDSTGVSTDTRKIKQGSIFFALKGDNFNGNCFATEAINNGAMAVVIDEKEYQGEGMILVDNVLETLQKLATYHREQFDIPIIALTGSNGKTTTKELIANILKQKYTTHYTLGNFNNHIGVPLTLLKMPKETEIAIIEMGANHQGEIQHLAEICKPNFGFITNIGKAHLEGFGGLEGVKKGKLELYDYIANSGGRFFVNTDDEKISTAVKKGRIEYQSQMPEKLQPSIVFYFQKHLVRSSLFGSYNLQNIQAAISIAQYFEVDLMDIVYGIESYIPKNNRSEYIHIDSNVIILDAYNANPSSMKLSLENFSQRVGNKIAVLGSMKELGIHSREEHQSLVDYALGKGINEIIFCGDEFTGLAIPNPHHLLFDIDDIKKILNLNQRKNFTILIKGSRANRLEAIIN